MEKITFNFDLQPKQREALKQSLTTPVFFYGGAKGGGKSHLVRVREISRRLKYPGTRGLIVRKTYPELLSNHIRKMFTEYPILAKWYNKSEKVINYPGGSITEFCYLKRTDDVYNFQGREYEDISIDETTQHEEDVFKILRTSLRTTRTDIKPTMFLTGNPGGIGHQWVKRIFIDRKFRGREKPEHFKFLQALVYDNKKLIEANPEYIEWLQDLPEHLRKAYLEGDWNIFAGQAFNELSYQHHLVEPFTLPPNTRYIAGYDHGYNHPFSFVLAAITPDGLVYVVNHVTGRLMETSEITKAIKDVIGSKEVPIYAGHDCWYPGRDGGPSVVEKFKEYGLRGFIQAKIAREPGVAQIRRYITLKNKTGMPLCKFFNTDKVVDVFNVVASMQFDDRKPEDVLKVDADLNGEGGDDPYDAFRYMLMSRTQPNPPEIQKNDPMSGNAILDQLLNQQLDVEVDR